jgi:two-component system sensor histidine kinase YesM
MFYSLKNRLISIFVLLLVVSFGMMSFLLFDQARSIIRAYIESSALEKMDEYASFIDMATTHIYDLASIVFNSDAVKAWDNALSDRSLPDGEKMLADISLSQFLTKATNSYSSVSTVTLYRQEGLWVSTDNQVVADRSFLTQAWYQDFHRFGNHWVPAHLDPVEASRSERYQVVSLLMPVGTFEPSLTRIVMKVNISSDFFLEPLNRIHLGDNGTIFLLDQDGRPMLAQNQYDSNPEEVRKVEEIRADPQPQGVVYLKNGQGRTEIMVYKKLKKNNWLLVGFVPEADLFAKLFKLRASIIVVTTLLLICAIVAATWLSYGITKPLSMLASAMRFVQKGDFASAEQRIPPERRVRNEVGFVTSTFRNMVSRLRQHIKTEFELKLLRQQAEYKALLMQINPHFLFNTLELMSSLAMQRRTVDTVRVIESLGKMLRFSLKISDDLVPLTEELNYLRHYISILQIRFGERLIVSIEEEGELGRLEIVKFILQPLVENAVKYSFLQQAAAKVGIRVRREEGRLHLIVADNGPGMPPDMVQELYAESTALQLDQILFSSSRRIGLRNVLARGRIYYGSLFDFAIESGPGQGTAIHLILPAQEEPHDVSRIDRG